MPLLSAGQAVPLVRKLELFGSARIDRLEMSRESGPDAPYTTTGNLRAFGLRYDPLGGLTFRVTRSNGVRPPTFSQVEPPATLPTRDITFTDPLRPGSGTVTLTPAQYVTGGNPDLAPETMTSTNFGIILMPRRVQGLRVSVDYLENLRDDAIFSFSSAANGVGVLELLELESELPGRVQRGAADSTGVGEITFVDLRFTNVRQILSKSVDFTLDKQWEDIGGGRLQLSLAGTRNLSYKFQTSNTGAAVERIRNPVYSASQQIAWRGDAQLRWERPTWSIGWKTRFYDYLLLNPNAAASSNYIALQGADRAPRELEHDINFSYRAPAVGDPRGAQWLLSGTSFAFGVNNVFDRAPRFWAADTDRGVAPYDSIRGRSLWLRVSKDFQ